MNQRGIEGATVIFAIAIIAAIVALLLGILVAGGLLAALLGADCNEMEDTFSIDKSVCTNTECGVVKYWQCAEPSTEPDAEINVLADTLEVPHPTTSTRVKTECFWARACGPVLGVLCLPWGWANWGQPMPTLEPCAEGETCEVASPDLDGRGASATCVAEPQHCGNGVCDDGTNGTTDLGENTRTCEGDCPPGRVVPNIAIPARCGDGIINQASEECDAGESTITVEQLCNALPDECTASDPDSLSTFSADLGLASDLSTIVPADKVCVKVIEDCTNDNFPEWVGAGGKTCDEVFDRTDMIGGPPTCLMTGEDACTFDRTDNRGTVDGECTSCGNEICENGTNDTPIWIEDDPETSDNCPEDCAPAEM